jgi:hypothetical protein
MLSIGLWRWYINTTITIMDIILRPAIHLKQKHDVSDNGFGFPLQMEPIQLGPMDRDSLLSPDLYLLSRTE